MKKLLPLLLSVWVSGNLSAQQSDPLVSGAPLTSPAPKPVLQNFSATLVADQRRILTNPFHVNKHDLPWVLPLSAGIAFLAASDTRNMTERLHTNAASRTEASNLSNAALVPLIAIPAGLYWWSWRHDDSYSRHSVLLSARAVVDALVTTEMIGAVARRERPLTNNASGQFEKSSWWDSSFPSHHAAIAWSLASVIADRYPGWLTQLGVYGAASAVSLSRIGAQQHFPSDVIAGSALGFLVGKYVAHGDHLHAFRHTLVDDLNPDPKPETGSPVQGSMYVPMDSWIYPALDRMAALGLILSQISGLRPWTRNECGRQVAEARRLFDDAGEQISDGIRAEGNRLLTKLEQEFPPEENARPSLVLDSIYTRNGAIVGRPLEDSFHFGQTSSNDFGRPFGQGWNSQEGFIARAESGRFFALVRGEYQQAPGDAAYSGPVEQLISNLDSNPRLPALTRPETRRFRAIEAYAGVRLGNFDISVGKQSLYWGPTFDAPFSFSNNAEPTKNARLSLVNPLRLPGILRYMGEIRAEAVMGKLGGQSYTWRPWFNGAKVSFKLTDNLELGFTRWSILWGVGHPETLGSLINNVVSATSPIGGAGVGRNDPGDRKAGFDFRYRVPGLRNWLTLYSDMYSDDDPSPLAAPRRAAINPGIYLTHVPGLPRLDFRVEAPMTRPFNADQGGTFIYYNNSYHSGNTNYGYLLGNSEGRDARAIEAWTRYWFTPRDRFEAGYRQIKTATNFLPGGGTQSDVTARQTFDISKNLFADVSVQYERFFIPVLGAPQRNLSAVVQFTWQPETAIIH